MRVELPPVGRFIGAKTGLHLQGEKWVRSPSYGQWVNWPARVSFKPDPKRRSILPSGRLECWPRLTVPSQPYRKANVTDEVQDLKIAKDVAEEQPMGDYVEE
jgi:hypothetical protein